MSESRPSHFPPGTLLGDHYKVEGLVRLAEGRMFYLVDDDRPDRPTRRCVSCGYLDNPRSSRLCRNCGKPLGVRRYLMSSRWESRRFDAWQTFAGRDLEHPGLAMPTDVLRLEDQILSFVPYGGEGLMLDEAAPLSNQRVLYLAQRAAGTLAWLAAHGVLVAPLRRSQLLLGTDGAVQLFDLDVEDVLAGPVPPEAMGPVIRSMAELLQTLCHVRAGALNDFLQLAAHGDYPTLPEFGRAVEQRYDTYAAMAFPPTLAAMSDVGLARQLNEDNWGWTSLGPSGELYIVADGMGGHDGGEVASELAVATMARIAREREAALEEGRERIESMLHDAFVRANNAVKDEADRKGNDMGTTLVGLLIHAGRHAYVANVGDSRAYLFRDGALHQISTDHSFVQKLVERGKITKEEARNHPQSNILLRTVGTERDVEVDLFRVTLEPGDRVLICSDGLWGEVEDEDLAGILATYNDPRAAARELVRASHQGGGKDNCTLILVVVR